MDSSSPMGICRMGNACLFKTPLLYPGWSCWSPLSPSAGDPALLCAQPFLPCLPSAAAPLSSLGALPRAPSGHAPSLFPCLGCPGGLMVFLLSGTAFCTHCMSPAEYHATAPTLHTSAPFVPLLHSLQIPHPLFCLFHLLLHV